MDDSIFNTLNPNEISRQKKMSGKNFIQKRNALPISPPLVSHTRARAAHRKTNLNHADDDRNFVDVNVLLSDAVKTGGMRKSHHVFGTSSTSSSLPTRNHDEKHIIIIIVIE